MFEIWKRYQESRRLYRNYEMFLYDLSVKGSNQAKSITLSEMRSQWAKTQESVKKVQGWVPDLAGMGLYQLARFGALGGIIVELGSWKGRSTIWLAAGIRDRGNGRVYAVDTWQGSASEEIHAELLKNYESNQLFEEFLSNISAAKLQSHVEPIKGDTLKIGCSWPQERRIETLFIDASHEYVDVKKDFLLWSNFVEIGGHVVFDDVPSWEGPTKFLSELPLEYRFVGVFPGQYIVQKNE